MTDQEKEVLGIVKTRLGIGDESQDGIIGSYISEVGYRIKHYCQRSDIPKALIFVWASIVQHLVFYVQRRYDGELDGSVASMKIGDTQISDNQPNKIISPSVSNRMIDEVIMNYLPDLHRYRKLKW